MNPDKIRTALNTLAVGLGELSEALTIDSSPAAGTPGGAGRESGAAVPSGTPAPSFESQYDRERMLAECPVHQKPWTVKEGGISRNGKPYSAFWKCDNKNPDGSWCDKKPDKAWAASHDPEQAVMALPF